MSEKRMTFEDFKASLAVCSFPLLHAYRAACQTEIDRRKWVHMQKALQRLNAEERDALFSALGLKVKKAHLLPQGHADDPAGIQLSIAVITYHQLVKTIMQVLGRAGCEAVQSALGLTVPSSSLMVLHLLRVVGLLSFVETDNTLKMTDEGRKWCVESIVEKDEESQPMSAEIRWRSDVVKLILKHLRTQYGCEISAQTLSIAPDEADDRLTDVEESILRDLGDEAVSKLCLLWGYRHDNPKSSLGMIIDDVLYHGVNVLTRINNESSDRRYGIGAVLTDTGQIYGYEVTTLKNDGGVSWNKTVILLILQLIEKKTGIPIPVPDEAIEKLPNKICSSDIADFLYENLEAPCRRRLFEMMNNNKVGYKIKVDMMKGLMTEIGFINEGCCEFDLHCLTQQGENWGTARAVLYIKLSRWKPTMVPFLCSYFNEKLATCTEVKPGEFITLNDIIAAITGPVKEKTGRRYVTKMEVEALKNNDAFQPFYVDRAGPHRWKPACIPLMIDYIVAASTPSHS